MVGLWVAGIEARLVYLQVDRHDDLVARAERQHERTQSAPAKRGDIVDRHGRVLASSVDADTIYAVPSEIDDATDAVRSAVRRARRLHAPRNGRRWSSGFGGRSAFAYVRRQVSPDAGAARRRARPRRRRLHEGEPPLLPEQGAGARTCSATSASTTPGWAASRRPTTRRSAASDGKLLVQTDARRHAFSRLERPPTAGVDLELTIDEYLQHIAERELRAGVAGEPRRGGTAIVMDPHTGEILAMANEPTFNPNAYRDVAGDRRAATAPSRISTSRARRSRSSPRRRRSRRSVMPVDAIDRRQRRASSASAAASSTTRTTTACCRSPTSSSSRATSARSRSASGSAPSG